MMKTLYCILKYINRISYIGLMPDIITFIEQSVTNLGSNITVRYFSQLSQGNSSVVKKILYFLEIIS